MATTSPAQEQVTTPEEKGTPAEGLPRKINLRQHQVIMSYIRQGKHLENGFYQCPTESKEVQKLTHDEAKLYIARLSGKPAPEGPTQEKPVKAEIFPAHAGVNLQSSDSSS